VSPITRTEVFGAPSDEARAALDDLGASYHPQLTGFQR